LSTAKIFRWGKVVAGVVLLIVVVGCHSPPPVPVDYRPPPPSEKINYHLVSQGETLFSIAWRYEKDVQKLARANGLSRPYTIYRGQRLTLDTRNISTTAHRPKPSANSGSTITSRPASKAAPKTAPKTTVTKKANSTWASNWRWQWPVEGRVTKRFNSTSLFKGIDVQSHAGAPVVAAAPGVVVYSGSGLRGYGRLIIVKHNDVYLSAYAHNSKILIKEGQSVKGGQKISEVGGDPSNTRRLYFEIRKDGKPVDPLRYLPKR
jgi:lipoprotein NlpD